MLTKVSFITYLSNSQLVSQIYCLFYFSKCFIFASRIYIFKVNRVSEVECDFLIFLGLL